MLCPSCKHENRAGRKFCVHCGVGLELSCPSCGASAEPGEPFCGECGKSLTRVATPAAQPDPRSYTPKHLAEKILTSRFALEGERKQVTVLFVDVKGSMDLAEQLDPEEWHAILDKFFGILTDGVHRFEGSVTSTPVMGSWRCSGRRSRTKTTPGALATRYSTSTTSSSATPMS